jgi:hypothetical protein
MSIATTYSVTAVITAALNAGKEIGGLPALLDVLHEKRMVVREPCAEPSSEPADVLEAHRRHTREARVPVAVLDGLDLNATVRARIRAEFHSEQERARFVSAFEDALSRGLGSSGIDAEHGVCTTIGADALESGQFSVAARRYVREPRAIMREAATQERQRARAHVAAQRREGGFITEAQRETI